jgi:lipopolysaccharide export system protein LptA
VSTQQVIFIDSRVPDIQDLLAGLEPGAQAFVLDAGSDGLQQIADILAANNLSDLSSISIVSHGATGELALGSSLITDGTLADHSGALAAIGASLAPAGAVQLYGCGIAQGQAGQQFINDFSTLAGGAAVDAATHMVGSAALGGSWTLDASSNGATPLPAASTAPFTAAALADFPGQLVAGPTGQLYFRINQGSDVQLGAIDNTGALATPHPIYYGGGNTSGTPQNLSAFNGNETSVAVDTAAGLVFSIGIGNAGSYDAVSVHNLNTGALIETIEFGANTGSAATDDVVQALALNPFNNTLYVGDWGIDSSTTGVAAFTYDPATGLLTPSTSGSSATTITTTIGASSTTSTASGIYLFTANDVPSYTNATAFYLDSADHKLYYVDDDAGYNFSPFSPTNAVYVVDTSGPAFTATQLTSSTQFPTANQNLSGHDEFLGPNGSILSVAVDVADGVVFFETTDDQGSANNALWRVNTTGANQTATKVTLPAGVTLNFAGQINAGGDAGGLTFDPSTKQLYLTNADNSLSTPDTGAIYQLQYNPTTHGVTLVNTYDTAQLVGATPATVDPTDAPSTTTFDVLPTLLTSGTTNPAIEQSAAVNLLAATPTLTDPDGNHLAGATVHITGGTFTAPPSNESSAADDHLSVNGATSGLVAGTSITISYSSATETLTLTGYDTLTDYQTALGEVQYNATGDNPTNYGSNTTRTITWQVNDGAIGNPVGPDNVTTTTLTVVGVNDPPTLSGTVNASFTENGPPVTLSPAVTISDPDSLSLASATVAITGGTFTGDGDVLATSTVGTSITASYNSATETLTLTGTDTFAHYQTVLDRVTFVTPSDNPADYGSAPTRRVTWTLNDGSASNATSSVTTTVSITAVNDPPTLTGTTNASFTENGPPVVLSPAASVSDPDNLNLASATVAITGGTFAGDGDVLAANVSGTAISASYNAAIETLVLAGSDSLAHYQQVIDSIAFSSTSDNPDDYGSFTTRQVRWQLNDGSASFNLSSAVTTTVGITAVNDPPTLTGTTNASFTEKGSPVLLSGSATVSDPDSLTLVGATVAITGGTFAGDGDVLGVSTAGTAITASYNAATETLVLAGSDSLAHYQQVLDSITFNSTSNNPDDFGSFTTRQVSWQLNDGAGSFNLSSVVTSTVGITAVNDPPTLSNVATSASYTEQAAAVTLSPAVTVSDPDSLDLASATVAVTGGTFAGDGDLLAANVSGTAISASYNAATETLVLAGSDTLANYQQVLDSITFSSTSDNPDDFGSSPTRQVTWQLNDGSASFNLSSAATTTVGITAVNDPPTLTGTTNASFTEKGPPVVLSGSATVSDPDSLTLVGATVAITGGTFAGDGDVLGVSTAGTAVTASYNAATETLVLAGSDSLAHYQQVLDSITFNSTSNNPDDFGSFTTRQVSWQLNDGSASFNLSSVVTSTVSITAVNDPPTLTGTTNASFTENGSPVTLSPAVTVSDPDSLDLASATVAVTGGTFAGDGDLLAANVSGTAISASYNAATETLVLAGADTLANYQQVLDSITFNSTSHNPDDYGSFAARQVSWQLNDGSASFNLSSVVTTTVGITAVNDPPTLTGTTNASFTENGPPVVLSGSASVSDPDSLNLASATVAITGGTFAGDGDVLAANTTGTAISASYNAATETLVLAGSDTLAHYQQVLDSVTFATPSHNPTDFGADPTRTITWRLNDGAGSFNLSSVVTSTVSITAVNDPPTLSNVATSAGYTEQAAAVTLSGALAVSDPDNLTLAGATVKIAGGTFTGDGDVLGVSTAGTSITASYNSSTETLVLSGTDTLADYQSVLESVTFFDPSDNPTNYGSNVTRTITWVVTDGSASNATSNVATTTLNVTAVNDPPTLAGVPSAVSFSVGQTLTLAPALVVSDPDNLTLANATVRITGGTFAGDGDVLAANVSGTGISASYNAATETLTLTGSDTLAHYQHVLDSVTFTSGSNPTNAGSDPTRTLSWVVNDGSGSNNTATATTTISISAPLVKNDFNGDRISDIVFQDGIGLLHPVMYLMNGTSVPTQATLPTPGLGWHIVGSGDFNSDAKADILWQNIDGTPMIWTMNGSTVTSETTLSDPGLNWHAVGTGDFNGDGKSDILFQNVDGTPMIWEMNGTSVASTATLSNPGSTWTLVGTGDFNGDGKSDLVFQKSNGTPMIWEMNGTSVIATATLPKPSGAGSWKLIGTGDFNGDGDADLLFQKSNGSPMIWEMNGTSIAATATLANPGADWHAIGTGDYNRDGKSDILFQNVDGTPMVWTMNGTSVTATTTLPNPGPLLHANTG